MKKFKKHFGLSFRFMYGAVIAAGMVPDAPQGAPSTRQQVSIEEINGRAASLQNSIDSLFAVRDRLRRDSSAAVQDIVVAQAEDGNGVNDALVSKQKLIEGMRQQYEKARLDSASLVAGFRERIAQLHREIARYAAAVASRSNELITLSRQRDDGLQSQDIADEQTIARLNSQIIRCDSIIRVRQAALPGLTARRDRLLQDSLQAAAKRASDRNKYSQQISRFGVEIAAHDEAIGASRQKLANERSENQRKLSVMKSSVARMQAEQNRIDGRISLLSGEVSTLTAERNRITGSSSASRKRYEQLRLPYEKAVTDAEDRLKRSTGEKKTLFALREKLRLDVEIDIARNELDQTIQLKAQKKRGAKKLVERREAELDSLLSTLDYHMRQTPGLREKANQMRAPTLARKIAMTDSAIDGIDGRISSATAALEKARRASAAFEQKNPPPGNPSAPRIVKIDSLCTARKKEIIQMTGWSDSLGVQVRESQGMLGTLASSLQVDADAVAPDVKTKKDERVSITAKRSQLLRDSAQNDAANTAALQRINGELASTISRAAVITDEIAQHAAERDKTNETIAVHLEAKKGKSAAQSAQKRQADSIAAAKQGEITELSMKTERLRQDSVNLAANYDREIRAMNPSPSALAASISRLTREVAALRAQSDSQRKKTLTAEDRIAGEARNYESQIIFVNRQIVQLRKELASLASAREDAYSRQNEEQSSFDSLVDASEREIASATARLEKFRQDSSAAESAIRQFSQRMRDDSSERDAAIALQKQELDALLAGYNQAREDSVQAGEQLPGALLRFQQASRSIDALIAVKERELADLRLKKEKNRQDSSIEHKRQLKLLASAHDEIVRRADDLERKQTEMTLAATGTKRNRPDAVSVQRKTRESLIAANMEIQRLNGIIEKKKTELARLKRGRDPNYARAGTSSQEYFSAAPKTAPSRQTVTPAPVQPTFSPAGTVPQQQRISTNVEIAQKRSEEIYTLLGENSVAEATKLFRQLQMFLKMNLDPEAFQTLKNAIEQMNGGG